MTTKYSEVSILLYLIACAINNEKPNESILEKVNFEQLFTLSKSQCLSSITYMALQNTEAFSHADKTLVKQWKEAKEKVIRKNLMLDNERQQILTELEKKHIWYMPLKGAVLKQLYPQQAMREMSDNDILYDASYQKEVKKIFKERGYKVDMYAQSNHDVYQKEPLYNFEMHTSLFEGNVYPEFSNMFDNNPNILIKDENSAYARQLSDEDFYIYLTAHSYKHYDSSGTGLRNLVDFYIMNKAFKNVDWEYIIKQLKILKIDDYELNCRTLSKQLFEKAILIDETKLSQKQQELLSNLSSSGMYGSQEQYVSNTLNKISDDGNISTKVKIKYFIKRLFPSRELYKFSNPLFYKLPILLPLLWLYRIIKVILFDRKRIYSEIKTTIQYNKEKK